MNPFRQHRPNSDIRHAGVSKPLECYEHCVDSRRDILQPIVVAFTQQLREIEFPLLPHRRALPMCVYTTHGLRWPFAALLAVAGLALGGQAMGSLRQRRVLSSVTVKRRKSWLLAASALASLSLGISEPALAQTCTPVDNPSTSLLPSPAPPARVPLTPTSTSVGPPHPPPRADRHASGCPGHRPQRLAHPRRGQPCEHSGLDRCARCLAPT